MNRTPYCWITLIFFHNSKFYLVLLLPYDFRPLLLDISCMFSLFQQILKNNNTGGSFFFFFSVPLIHQNPSTCWSLTYHTKLAAEILHSPVIWDKTFTKKFGAVWEIWESKILCPAKELDHLSFSRNWCLHLLYYVNSTSTFSKVRKEKTSALFQCCCSKTLLCLTSDYTRGYEISWNILVGG